MKGSKVVAYLPKAKAKKGKKSKLYFQVGAQNTLLIFNPGWVSCTFRFNLKMHLACHFIVGSVIFWSLR